MVKWCLDPPTGLTTDAFRNRLAGFRHSLVLEGAHTVTNRLRERFSSRITAGMLALHPHLSGNTLNSWRELIGKIYNPEAGKHRWRVLIPPASGLPAVTMGDFMRSSYARATRDYIAGELESTGRKVYAWGTNQDAVKDFVNCCHAVINRSSAHSIRQDGEPLVICLSLDGGNMARHRDGCPVLVRAAYTDNANSDANAEAVAYADHGDNDLSGIFAFIARDINLIARTGFLPPERSPAQVKAAQTAARTRLEHYRARAAAVAAELEVPDLMEGADASGKRVGADVVDACIAYACAHPTDEEVEEARSNGFSSAMGGTAVTIVITGDYVAHGYTLGHGSHNTDPKRFNCWKVADGEGQQRRWRSPEEDSALCHARLGVPCPACNETPVSFEDMVRRALGVESLFRDGQHLGTLKAHLNVLRPCALDLPRVNFLPGYMHFCHDTFKPVFNIIWAHIESRCKTDPQGARFLKLEVLKLLNKVGIHVTLPKNESVANSKRIAKPDFRGADLWLMRTTGVLYWVLARVYKLPVCAPAAETTATQDLADQLEEEMAMLADVEVDARAEQAAADAVSAPLDLLITLIMATFSMQDKLHATLNVSSVQEAKDAHANAFKETADEWARMLRAASEDKDTVSQYITIACDIYPDLIRTWGRLVVLVCEQVQERYVHVAKVIFHHQVCSRKHIGEQLRRLSASRTSQVHYTATCAQQALSRMSAKGWALQQPEFAEEHRRTHQKLAAQGAGIATRKKEWVNKKATPTVDLFGMHELAKAMQQSPNADPAPSRPRG